MLAIAGAMALLLGIVGIYGVISYSVSQRTREIGIRMALGAQRRGSDARCSSATAWGSRPSASRSASSPRSALTRLMASMLFEVGPLDPLTYAAVSLGLAAAAALASYVPARRATGVNPVTALRAERTNVG